MDIKIFWKKDYSDIWNKFYSNSLDFKVDRHIPVPEKLIKIWEHEANIIFLGTSYSDELKRLISWAKRCNERNDEVLVVAV